MLEELKKNFVLLSKVAKEKKYAQEYLGLLARRGDIGSIRIGKRWYTTWAWFQEFLENSQKKKIEEVSEVKILEPVKIEKEKIVPRIEPQPSFVKIITGAEVLEGKLSGEEEIKINIPIAAPDEKEIIQVAPILENIPSKLPVGGTDTAKSESIISEIKINNFRVPIPATVKKNYQEKLAGVEKIKQGPQRIAVPVMRRVPNRIPFRNMRGNIRRPIQAIEIRERKEPELSQNISVEEKNRYAVPYPEIKLKKREGVFSPEVSTGEKIKNAFLPRFAYAVSFAIILFLIAVSGYFIYSGGLLNGGIVAGASDDQTNGFSSIKTGGDYFVAGAGDKMKESLSISQVIVEAAIAKTAKSK